MKKPKLKTQFSNYKKCGITFPKKSQTQQSFKDECNINNIVDRYQRTGEIPVTRQVKYGEAPPNDMTHLRMSTAAIKSAYEAMPDDQKKGLTLDQYLEQQSQPNAPESEITAPDSETATIVDVENQEQPNESAVDIEAEIT